MCINSKKLLFVKCIISVTNVVIEAGLPILEKPSQTLLRLFIHCFGSSDTLTAVIHMAVLT